MSTLQIVISDPVDMEFAPDGSLYIEMAWISWIGPPCTQCPWSLRDHRPWKNYGWRYPQQTLNHSTAKIWRCKYPELLENLKLPGIQNSLSAPVRELLEEKKCEVLESWLKKLGSKLGSEWCELLSIIDWSTLGYFGSKSSGQELLAKNGKSSDSSVALLLLENSDATLATKSKDQASFTDGGGQRSNVVKYEWKQSGG